MVLNHIAKIITPTDSRGQDYVWEKPKRHDGKN